MLIDKEIFGNSREITAMIMFLLILIILSVLLTLSIDFSKEKRTQYEILKLYRERLEKIISDSQNLQEQYDSLNEKLKDV